MDDGGRFAAAITRHPREFVGIVMAVLAVFAIFINALFMQHGPHPAPIFAARPQAAPVTPAAPVALPRPRVVTPAAPATVARSQAQIVGDIQRELGRKGFYDGAADGIWGAKTDTAARDFLAGRRAEDQRGGKRKPAARDRGLHDARRRAHARLRRRATTRSPR